MYTIERWIRTRLNKESFIYHFIRRVRIIIELMIFNVPSYIFSKFYLSKNIGTSLKNRDSFDQDFTDSLNRQLMRKSQLPKVSAILRVKNGQDYLESSILSIAPLVSEIVVIDNLSTDNTRSIVSRLTTELEGVADVRYHTYDKKLALAGEGYLRRVQSGEGDSLADYYNYCFSLASGDYVMKWDAHIIMFPSAIDKVQKVLGSGPDGVKFRGLEIFGKVLSNELSLYKNNGLITYIDTDNYESVSIKRNMRLKTIFIPIFIHIKRISYVKYGSSENKPLEEMYK